MKIVHRLTLITMFALAAASLASSAFADGHGVWNTQACEIKGGGYNDADLDEALQLNNKSLNRGCTWVISFVDTGIMALSHQITIEGDPVHNGYGTLISRPDGVNFTLDASGRGDCPVVVTTTEQGALPKIDMARITLKVDNINKAVCKPDSTALYSGVDASGHVTAQTDAQKDYVYIHSDLTIVPATPPVNPVPTCTISAPPHSGGGFDVTWSTTNATSATVSDGSSNVGSTTSGTVLVNPSSATTYTLTAHGAGGDCTPAHVTVTPPVVEAPTCTLTSAAGGGGYDLTWSSTHATSATLSNGMTTHPVATSGTEHVTPSVTTTYTLSATGAGGTCTKSTTITISPSITDEDGDGIPDATDLCDAGTPGGIHTVTPFCNGIPATDYLRIANCNQTIDTDHDNIGNYCDSDMDGDGLDNATDPDPYDPDADNDGKCDGPSAVTGVCTAGPDPCPLQGDILPNSHGVCAAEPVTPGDADPDHDGCTTSAEDSNHNGAYNAGTETNPNNPDTDGDGYTDCTADCFPLDATKHVCGGTTVIYGDADKDGICEGPGAGFDSDGHACTPNALGQGDNCALPNPDQKDDNHNGLGDACENAISPSLDGDGDDVLDDLEVNVFHTDPTKTDTDGDGLSDGQEINGMTYQGGRGPLDPDVDADGICDGPATVNDADGNEICNAGPNGSGDNCPLVANQDQADEDGNNIGDACQDDMDGDGKLDTEDNCPFMANQDQKDVDGDGIGDACDPDFAESAVQGCGCRIDGKGGKSQGSAGGMIPFLAMAVPMVVLRLGRRRKEVKF